MCMCVGICPILYIERDIKDQFISDLKGYPLFLLKGLF